VSKKNPTPLKTWRDVLPIHKACKLFEQMSPAELRELGEDIKKNVLHFSIVLGGRSDKRFLIDGRNRLDALEMVGFNLIKNGKLDPTLGLGTCPHVNYMSPSLTDAEITALVISANIHRRHLKPERRRELLVTLLKLHPEKSNRQIAKTVGKSHPHVAKVRKTLEESGDVETVTTSIDTKGRKQPAKRKKTAGEKFLEESERSFRAAWKAEGRSLRDYDAGLDDTDSAVWDWRRAKGRAAIEAEQKDWLRDHPGNPLPEHMCSLTDEQHAEYTAWAAKRRAKEQPESTKTATAALQAKPGDIGPTLTDEDDESEELTAVELARIKPKEFRVAFLIRADQAARFAFYSHNGPVPNSDMIEAADLAAERWTKLAAELRTRQTARRRVA
jgi:hypothetical protein